MANRGCVLPKEQGEQILVTNADPAAGDDFANVTVPAGFEWLLLAISFRIRCDQTVANRYPRLAYQVPGATAGIQVAAWYEPTVANETMKLEGLIGEGWGSGLILGQGNVAYYTTRRLVGLPTDFRLPPGSNIVIGVQQIQAGDLLDRYEAIVQQWRVA